MEEWGNKKIGVRGFEPPTPCSRSKCATRLRYTPNNSIKWILNNTYGLP